MGGVLFLLAPEQAKPSKSGICLAPNSNCK